MCLYIKIPILSFLINNLQDLAKPFHEFFFSPHNRKLEPLNLFLWKLSPPPNCTQYSSPDICSSTFHTCEKKIFPASLWMAIWTPVPGLVLTKRSSGVLMFNCVMHVTFWSCLTDKMDISHVAVKTASKLRNEKLLTNFCSSWLFKSTRWCWTNKDGFDVSPSQGNPVMEEHKKAVGSVVRCG